jgi:Mce-associated membrane protein
MTQDDTSEPSGEALDSAEPSGEAPDTADAATDGAATPEAADEATGKLSRAAKLEAKAAKMRAREQARADAAAQQAAEPAAASTIGWPYVVLALGLLLVVVLAVGLPVALSWHGQAGSRGRALAKERVLDADRATVIVDARTYATDFGTYNYKTIDQDFARVKAHLTPSFATSYDSISQTLKQTDVQLKGMSTATVQGVAVESLNTTQAVLLVFLDQSVTSTQSPTARIDRNRLRMTLQRQKNGQWLMSELAPV